MDQPPPPPPHGNHPRPANNSNLPPGKYDIFIIPPHSSGSGFLYLPSLKPNWNSFAAGFASALLVVIIGQTIGPAFRVWWNNFQGMGNVGVVLLTIAVGIGAWSLGRQSQDSGPGVGGGPRNSWGGYGPGAGGYSSGSNHNAGPPPNADMPPPPPPHGSPPPPRSGPTPGPQGGERPKHSWQQQPQADEPGTPPPQESREETPEEPPPKPKPRETPREAPQQSPKKPKEPPREPPKEPPKEAPKEPPKEPPKESRKEQSKGAWEKAREETRRKEEERKAKEAEQRKREEVARRLKELREKEARERARREQEAKERREREEREREQREKEQREREQREKEQREKEQRENRIREARERELRERLEQERALREKLEREVKEKEAIRIREAIEAVRLKEAARLKEAEEARKREQEAAKLREAVAAKLREAEAAAAAAARQREAEAARQREAEAARQREAEAARQREAEAARKREEEAARLREAEAAKLREAENSRRGAYAFSSVGEKTNPWPNGKPPPPPSSPNPAPKPAPSTTSSKPSTTSTKRPPAPSSNVASGVNEETYSFRPYDTPKTHGRKNSNGTTFTGSSYAPSHSTARTTPPPSERAPYETKDPKKIVIKAVYGFLNQFSKTPASQLISGVGPVTDGLILRISSEGIFIDDDVRNEPQREWDVKAWTLKMVEVWCPAHCETATVPKAAPKAHRFRSTIRGDSKTLTGDDAETCIAELSHSCKNECRLSPHGGRSTGSFVSSGRRRGLHLMRATVRDQEGRRHLFVIDEEEGWKVAQGLTQLLKGTQHRQLGIQCMSKTEAQNILEMLGW